MASPKFNLRSYLFLLLIVALVVSCSAKQTGTFIGETIVAPFRILTLKAPYPNQLAEIDINTAESRIKEGQENFNSKDIAKILSYVNKRSDWTINWNCDDKALVGDVRGRCSSARYNYATFISRIEYFQKFGSVSSNVVKSKSNTEMKELMDLVNTAKKPDQEIFIPYLLKEPFKDLIKSAYREQGDALKSIELFPEIAEEVQYNDFNESLKKDSISEYEIFLKKYKNSPFNADVYRRLDALLCQETLQKGTLKAYRAYISQHPSGQCATEIKATMEPLLCADVQDIDKLEDYKFYLLLYPTSGCSKRIAEKIDPLVWNTALTTNTQSSYSQYLEMLPNGQHSDLARDYVAIMGAIDQLSSKDEQVVAAASHKLSAMGSKLTERHVSLITDVMKSGTNKWSKVDGRESHCTWYKDTSARYYAANTLARANSPHISTQMKADARDVANKSVTRRKVTDPGWV